VDNFGELVGEIEIQGTAKIVDCVGCKYDEDFRRKGRVRSSRELKDGMVLGAESEWRPMGRGGARIFILRLDALGNAIHQGSSQPRPIASADTRLPQGFLSTLLCGYTTCLV
jgi:hypothetical protein